MVMDVELDADRLEVALDDRFASDAKWGCSRPELEREALPSFGTHPIRPFHPAVVREQLIGERRIKRRTAYKRLIARMIGRGMVGAERRRESLAIRLDQGLL